MSQHDYGVENGTGISVLTDINNVLAAIISQNSGPVEPTSTTPYMVWIDTGTNPARMKMRSSDDSFWVILPFCLAATALISDTVAESTAGAGVTIDGLTIKDSGFALGSDADGDLYYRAGGVLVRLAKGTALQRLRVNSGATAPEWVDSSLGLLKGYTKITYERTIDRGVDLNDEVGWITRELTKIVTDTTGAAQLTSNRITLPAGSYHCRVRAEVGEKKRAAALRLYNYTAGTDVLDHGGSPLCGITRKNEYYTELTGDFTIPAGKALEVRQYLTSGSGNPTSLVVTGSGTGRYVGVICEFFQYV